MGVKFFILFQCLNSRFSSRSYQMLIFKTIKKKIAGFHFYYVLKNILKHGVTYKILVRGKYYIKRAAYLVKATFTYKAFYQSTKIRSKPLGPLDYLQLEWSKIRTISLINEPSKVTPSKRKLLLDGHFNGSYSLAIVNRIIVKTLFSCSDTKVFIRPREGDLVNKVNLPSLEDTSFFMDKIEKSATDYDFIIYHHYPLVKPGKQTGIPLLIFFWEESSIPCETINLINKFYEGVIVSSWFVKKTLIDCGCSVPVVIITWPKGYNYKKEIQNNEKITFLHVSSCFPRKGADILLDAFNLLFKKHNNIQLIIKTFPNPHNNIQELIYQKISSKNINKVKVILEDFNNEQMDQLYNKANAMVLPSRGEGLGLPAIEAVEKNIPLIVTGYGPQTDLFKTQQVYWLNYEFSFSSSHLQTPYSVWVEPDPKDLIRQCDNLIKGLKDKDDHRLNEAFRKVCSPNDFSQNFTKTLNSFHSFNNSLCKPENKRKLSILSTWDEPCGIAEYTRYLSSSLRNRGYDIEIHAPDHKASKAKNETNAFTIRYSWIKSSGIDYETLINLKDPLWIQYHPGFFELDGNLANIIEKNTYSGYLRFITLHSTTPFIQYESERKTELVKCLRAFYRVAVHTLEDLNNLKEIGVIDNVVLLPQGCPISDDFPPHTHTEDFSKSDFIVGCFGFLFPHKGVLELIDAFSMFTKKLKKEDHERTKLLLLNSLHSNESSREYMTTCKKRIDKKKLQNKILFKTDFIEDVKIRKMLASCDLIILPYYENPESSSAAARMALSCNDLVAVSPSKIFDELRECTLQIDGFKPVDIQNLIYDVWSNPNSQLVTKKKLNRNEWCEEHDWSKIGDRHKNLLDAAFIDNSFLHS